MPDFYIFGFGLLVTLIVGTGLATLITAHNRALEQEEREAAGKAYQKPLPAAVGAHAND